MKISVKDQVPVQQNYNTIPKQVYSETKYYIENLLNKQRIIHSYSECSSPVVALRKKDRTDIPYRSLTRHFFRAGGFSWN